MAFLNKQKVLYNKQFGFQKKFSTAKLKFFNFSLKILDRQ